MSQAHLKAAGLVVITLIAVAAFQRHVMKLPVVGNYLPA